MKEEWIHNPLLTDRTIINESANLKQLNTVVICNNHICERRQKAEEEASTRLYALNMKNLGKDGSLKSIYHQFAYTKEKDFIMKIENNNNVQNDMEEV